VDCFASDSVIYFMSVKRTLFDSLTISARSAASCWLQGLEIEEIINMRKITRRSFLTAAAACGAAAALSACGGSSSASSSAAASSTVASALVAAASNGEKFTVGICQLVQHAALDAATQGFEDALTASFGENVTFDFQNAQGDSATCATIANGFVSSGVALIMANATPALQAAQAATNTIPILGTSVTEYGVALGLDNFSGTVGGNVSGTSDLAPLDQQADMIVEWMPEVKKVGLLYCSAEANSQYQVDEVQKYLEAKGVTATQYAFSDSNDLSSVCQKAADENDALYVPTDNTVAANTGIVDGVCRPAKKPVFAGEEGICSGCGVATLSISYYDLGYTTGEMAVKILNGESDISTMAIEYTDVTKKYNKAVCDNLGLTVPEGYVEIEA
jgi:putative ABC transport system substrate-binding protein